MLNVLNGGYQVKLGADVLREASKQDELQLEGVEKSRSSPSNGSRDTWTCDHHAPTPHRRKFAIVLSVAMTGGVVAGFLTGMPGVAPLIAVPVVVVCVFAAGFAMLKLRPRSTSLLAAPLAVIVVAGLCAFGGHSLWLTAFGELVPDCELISVNTHTSSKPAARRDLDKGFI